VSGARTTERVPAAALDLHTPRRQLRRDGTGSEGDDEESVQHVRPRREVLVVDVDGMLHDPLQKARHGDVERGHLERKAKWVSVWKRPPQRSASEVFAWREPSRGKRGNRAN